MCKIHLNKLEKLTKDVGEALTSSAASSSSLTCEEAALDTRDCAPDLCSRSPSIAYFVAQNNNLPRELEYNSNKQMIICLGAGNSRSLLSPVSYYGEAEPLVRTAD